MIGGGESRNLKKTPNKRRDFQKQVYTTVHNIVLLIVQYSRPI